MERESEREREIENMEEETFDTIYGSCKAVSLRSDGTLVAQIVEWTLANGDHAKMYIPCVDDDVRFFLLLLNLFTIISKKSHMNDTTG